MADAQKPKKELILSLHSNLNETGIGYCPKIKYTNLLTQSIKFDDYPCKSKKFLTQPMFLWILTWTDICCVNSISCCSVLMRKIWISVHIAGIKTVVKP